MTLSTNTFGLGTVYAKQKIKWWINTSWPIYYYRLFQQSFYSRNNFCIATSNSRMFVSWDPFDKNRLCYRNWLLVVPAGAAASGRATAGITRALPDCSTNHSSADRISGQCLFYYDYNFTKSKGNLRFRRIVPLFVSIGVCVTTHDDGTAIDVTIGICRHNRQATNHERNDKPWFSLPKKLCHVICKWCYAVEWMIIRKYESVMPWIWKKLYICKFKGHENFEAMRFYFGHVALTVTGRMTGSVR